MSEYPKIILDENFSLNRYRIVQKAENYCTIEHADGIDSMGVTRWKTPENLTCNVACILIQCLLAQKE